MYLNRLYKTNKVLFVGIVGFAAVQLFINAKQGVVFSPIYHYGMYSGVTVPSKQYCVTEVVVDGQLLHTQDFTPAEWDKICYTVELYRSQQAWNHQQWGTTIKRLLHLQDSSKYTNHITDAYFNGWYKNYLESILHKKVRAVYVNTVKYSYNGTSFIKIPG